MSLTATYLVQGGGATGTVGTSAIVIGNIGNLVGDTFEVTYQPQGVEVETLTPGLSLPLVDTTNFSGTQIALGGASVFRANSLLQMLTTSAPGIILEVTSFDGPNFIWDNPLPNTANAWAITSGGNAFQEFIAGFSKCFTNTYVSYNLATWAITVEGYSVSGNWVDSGSGISGASTLGAVGSAQAQVLGQSAYKNLTMVPQVLQR